MEIKLTADWILSHGDETYFSKGKGYIILYDYDFRYRFIELALNTLNVAYESDDCYTENDDGSKNSFIQYSFGNIEEFKETCPKLYDKFQNTIVDFDD